LLGTGSMRRTTVAALMGTYAVNWPNREIEATERVDVVKRRCTPVLASSVAIEP
jgi:hypothetical protein